MWRPGREAGMAWIATADGIPTDDSLVGCDRFLPSEGYGENADWFVSPETDAVARFCDGEQAYWILYNTMDASNCLENASTAAARRDLRSLARMKIALS